MGNKNATDYDELNKMEKILFKKGLLENYYSDQNIIFADFYKLHNDKITNLNKKHHPIILSNLYLLQIAAKRHNLPKEIYYSIVEYYLNFLNNTLHTIAQDRYKLSMLPRFSGGGIH